MRTGTMPLLTIGDHTEPIVLDTTRLQVRARGSKRIVVPFVATAPSRPAWANGVVPKRRR
jgi:hypothetical protein